MATTLTDCGARTIPEFDGVHDVWPRGERLRAVREAAAAYKVRFKEQGQVRAVRSVDIAAAPYPVKYAFHDAVSVPTLPLISMINRMIVVQYDDWAGTPRTLVFEPTVPAGSAEAPFYANLQTLMDKVPGAGLVEKLLVQYYNEPGDVLAELGLSAADIDFCTFDHLHVQDPRMILGSSAVIPGESEPRTPLFGDARMLVHSRELATLQSLHPMQWAWYVEGGLDGVDPDRFVTFDADVELGPGVALLWTPGHTDGNHSLVLNTPDGVWVSSENGISLDNWQPELSKIPGVRRYHEQFGREICPNANTLEDSLDQYDSMVKEKTMADPCRDDPRWLQILPSTELVSWKRFWPVVPTYAHGGIAYGEIRAGLR
ncbi:MBL fold metallo-hydrolase [Nocardioides pacificus]